MKINVWRFCLGLNLMAIWRAIYCRAVGSNDEAFMYMAIACILLSIAVADLRVQVKR